MAGFQRVHFKVYFLNKERNAWPLGPWVGRQRRTRGSLLNRMRGKGKGDARLEKEVGGELWGSIRLKSSPPSVFLQCPSWVAEQTIRPQHVTT